MAINVATKHLFVEINDEYCRNEYYIAKTIEQAREIQRKLIGENPCSPEDWCQCADDDEFMLWLDNMGEIKARHAGDTPKSDDIFVVGKVQDWAEAYDIGFFCTILY